jgi:hypothetical protein
VAATCLTTLLEAPTPDVAQNAALAVVAPALLLRRRGSGAGRGGGSGSGGEGHAEAVTDVLLEKLRRGGGLDGAERGACLALGISAGGCHAGDHGRRAAAVATLKARMADVGGGAGAMGAAAEGLGLLCRGLGAATAAAGPGAGAWRTQMLRDGTAALAALALALHAIPPAMAAALSGVRDIGGGDDGREGSDWVSTTAFRQPQGDASPARVGAAIGLTLAAAGMDAAESVGLSASSPRVRGTGGRGSKVAALLETFTAALEKSLTILTLDDEYVADPAAAAADVDIPDATDAAEADGAADSIAAAADTDAADAAVAAAAALPTAAASALAADAPVDLTVLRALRAVTAAVAAAAEGRHPVGQQSLGPAAAAAAGALLDSALSAGVGVPRTGNPKTSNF